MMRVDPRWWGGTILAVGLLGGCVTKGVTPREPCTNHLLEQLVSPGGGAKAIVFERRCPKPTSFSTQVSVLAADAHLSDVPGNAFVAGNGGRLSRGHSFVTVSWDGPNALRVMLAADAPVFRLEPSVGPVKITYIRRSAFGDGVTPAPAK